MLSSSLSVVLEALQQNFSSVTRYQRVARTVLIVVLGQVLWLPQKCVAWSAAEFHVICYISNSYSVYEPY